MDWRRKFVNRISREADDHVGFLRGRQARERGEAIAREEAEKRAKEDRTPIKPEEWIENEYFSGSFARTMYPKLKEHFCNIVRGRHEGKYFRSLFAGATRYGKTYLTMGLQGRSMYEVDCLANPQRTYHIQDESRLLYLMMNVSEPKARDAYFGKYSTWVRSTKYFVREMPPVSRIIRRLEMPKGVLGKYSGAIRSAAESEDLFFYVGDEINLYEIVEDSKRAASMGEKYDAAQTISTEVDLRMSGTFQRGDGTYPSPCMQIKLCKETYPKSYMRNEIADARRTGAVDRGEAYVIEASEWEMKPRRCAGCDGWVDEDAFECGKCGEHVKPVTYFWIRTSSRRESARIVKDRDEAMALKATARELQESHAPEDEVFQVKDVPLRYLPEAEKPGNLENFQRDKCGIPTEAISRLFRLREPIFRAVRKAGGSFADKEYAPEVCAHPFTALTTNLHDKVRLVRHCLARNVPTGMKAFNQKTNKEEDEYVWRPLVNPGARRYVGMDAGKSGDCFGFAMGHRAGWKKVVRMEYGDDGEAVPVEELKPHIFIDVVLRVEPPPGGDIPFSKMRGLVYLLSSLGFRIKGVRCDSWQHLAITEDLVKRGYDADVVSMDTDPTGYNYTRDAYYEDRISLYEYGPLEEELVELEKIVTGKVRGGHTVEKVDHPASGSKDVSDALAQVVLQVELNSRGMVSEEAAEPRELELEGGRQMVESEKRETERATAFEDGDYERMMDMEADDEWEW